MFAVFIHALQQEPRGLNSGGWPDNDERQVCGDCVDQFMRQWRILWGSWVAFYVVHCVRHTVEKLHWNPDQVPKSWGVGVSWILDLMHLVQTVMLVFLFWSMIRPTFKKPRREVHLILLLAVVIVGLLMSADTLFLLLKGGEKGVPVEGLIAAVIVGVTVATGMGLLVGRLESRHLAVDPVELGVLYLYTVTQPVFRIMIWMEYSKWDGKPDILASIAQGADFWLKLLALALKLGLYSVVYRQIKSGRLALYMLKVRVMHEEIRKEWEEFERDRLGPPDP